MAKGYVAEPPKLYGLHAPVIILKISDCCTQELDNSGSLLGVLEEPRIIHIFNSYRINMELPQHYNIWYKNNLHQSVKDL